MAACLLTATSSDFFFPHQTVLSVCYCQGRVLRIDSTKDKQQSRCNRNGSKQELMRNVKPNEDVIITVGCFKILNTSGLHGRSHPHSSCCTKRFDALAQTTPAAMHRRRPLWQARVSKLILASTFACCEAAIQIQQKQQQGILQRRPLLRQVLANGCGLVFGSKFGQQGLSKWAESSSETAWAISPADIFLPRSNGGVIQSRFSDDILVQLPPTKGMPSYPSFLEGEWDVTQTLTSCSAPLGPAFMGGPNGDANIGQASLDEANSKRNIPISFRLRYIRTDVDTTSSRIDEDRPFNTRQRLDAFAGRPVVASTFYTRDSITNRYNTAVLVQYRGPAAQKIFVTGFDREDNDSNNNDIGSMFWCSERQRSLFALTNASTAPPISTDSELLWQFHQRRSTSPNDDNNSMIVRAKLRIAGFLNPNDRLYFEAKRRAVTLQDYTLERRRRRSPIEDA